MAEQQRVRIINISFLASSSGDGAYGLTKNTVERMTGGMAHEVGQRGITVNCIAPGKFAFEAATSQLDGADAIVGRNAIKRLGTTRDLYGAMACPCSPAAERVTGQTIRVDAGGSLQWTRQHQN